MDKIAIIVAGGTGTRMGMSMPKQFIEVNEKPIVVHTITTFLQAYPEMEIVLVLPAEFVERGKEIAQQFFPRTEIAIVAGGATRFHSVQNGLVLVHKPSIVFVQDAVRCLLSTQLIHNCYEQAMDKGAAIPTVSARDSIRIIDGQSSKVVNRDDIRIVQTPQTFLSEILLPAFRQDYSEEFTDEATVVEKSGKPVFLIEGEVTNIKITFPIDLVIAEKFLEERSKVIV